MATINAFLLLGDRIAPRFDKTEKVLLYPADGSRELKQCDRVPVGHMKPRELCDFLVSSRIETLVCGGVKESCRQSLSQSSIRIIDNVIGSVAAVAALLAGGELSNGQVVD